MLVPWRADLGTVREQKRLLALIDPGEYSTTFESCDAASRLAPHHCTRFLLRHLDEIRPSAKYQNENISET